MPITVDEVTTIMANERQFEGSHISVSDTGISLRVMFRRQFRDPETGDVQIVSHDSVSVTEEEFVAMAAADPDLYEKMKAFFYGIIGVHK